MVMVMVMVKRRYDTRETHEKRRQETNKNHDDEARDPKSLHYVVPVDFGVVCGWSTRTLSGRRQKNKNTVCCTQSTTHRNSTDRDRDGTLQHTMTTTTM